MDFASLRYLYFFVNMSLVKVSKDFCHDLRNASLDLLNQILDLWSLTGIPGSIHRPLK